MKHRFLSAIFISFITFFTLLVPVASFATSGAIDVPAYAWGSWLGWVNFAASSSDVTVADTGLSGYAWSQNYGWINLAPTNGGVKNDGEGDLSGFAWGEDIGWINFDGVAINTSTGIFSGIATTTSLGNINFSCANCSVATTWRPSATPTPVVSVGEGYGVPYIPGVGPITSSTASPTPQPSASSSTATSASSSASSTSSTSTASLLAELNALKAQLAALKAQASAQGTEASSGANGGTPVFTRNLLDGMSGSDVHALQEYLVAQNKGPAAGALNAHGLTHYFGLLTKAALIEFQKTVGIRPASGYFGPITRGWINTHSQ